MRNATHQTRTNRTITIDFHNEATYGQLLGDGKAFVECGINEMDPPLCGSASMSHNEF